MKRANDLDWARGTRPEDWCSRHCGKCTRWFQTAEQAYHHMLFCDEIDDPEEFPVLPTKSRTTYSDQDYATYTKGGASGSGPGNSHSQPTPQPREPQALPQPSPPQQKEASKAAWVTSLQDDRGLTKPKPPPPASPPIPQQPAPPCRNTSQPSPPSQLQPVQHLTQPQQMSINVVSLGLEQLRGDDGDLWREYDRFSRASHREPPLPEETIQSSLRKIGCKGTIVTIDARMFPNPERRHDNSSHPRPEESCGNHIGLHPLIISRITSDKTFPAWFAEAKSKIMEAIQKEADFEKTVTIALVCRSGRHRSVATATIIDHILSTEYDTVTTVQR